MLGNSPRPPVLGPVGDYKNDFAGAFGEGPNCTNSSKKQHGAGAGNDIWTEMDGGIPAIAAPRIVLRTFRGSFGGSFFWFVPKPIDSRANASAHAPARSRASESMWRERQRTTPRKKRLQILRGQCAKGSLIRPVNTDGVLRKCGFQNVLEQAVCKIERGKKRTFQNVLK